jgi:hypothetical protein
MGVDIHLEALLEHARIQTRIVTLPRLELRVRARLPLQALGRAESNDRPATGIPCARGGLVTMRPSSRYENNGEEGRWGTPN